MENEQALEKRWVAMMGYYRINRSLEVDVMAVIEYGGGCFGGNLWLVLVIRDDRHEDRAGSVRDELICGFGLKVAFRVSRGCLRF